MTTTQKIILIAEDDMVSYSFFEVLLSDAGFHILRAQNGREAVDICRENHGIDLILMDLKMPVLDGNNAIREIRKFNREIPILAQSAYAFKEDRQHATNAGANDYITKPVDKKILFEKINALLYHV
jgi:CheY-like chemotaxis protein